MGLGIGFSRDSYDSLEEGFCQKAKDTIQTLRSQLDGLFSAKNINKFPNPDPSNYNILRYAEIGEFLVVEIQYPDCKNYEGKKILLYDGLTINDLKGQRLIDPHFSNNKKYKSPIARFEPTRHGWNMAVFLAKNNLVGIGGYS